MESRNYQEKKLYSRNYGFWDESEQGKIARAQISIAGVGGDGFQMGYKIAMMGGKKFKIADPENLEPENANRVPGANEKTYGRNKAEVFSEWVHNLHPDAEVEIYSQGVNQDNIEDFLEGSDLVLDESELTHLELGTMIQREALRQHIPDLFVMNIGFAAIATSFRAEGGKTFEDMMHIKKGTPLDEVAEMQVDFSRCLPYVPHYGDIDTLKEVEKGAPFPSISQGVDVASAIGSTEAFLHIVGNTNKRREPIWYSNFRYFDSYNGKSGIKRYPMISHYKDLLIAACRSAANMNPKGAYSSEDRERRQIETSQD